MQTYFHKPTPLPMQSLSSFPPDQVEDNSPMHSELMNNDDEIFQGWTSDLEYDDVIEPLLDAEGDGVETESCEMCILSNNQTFHLEIVSDQSAVEGCAYDVIAD